MPSVPNNHKLFNLGSATRSGLINYIDSCNGLVTKTWPINYNGTNGADGSYQTWSAPCSGNFKLEAWGAQGGDTLDGSYYAPGGYGGYAVGMITLNKNEQLVLAVGGQGAQASLTDNTSVSGGWNGGGTGSTNRQKGGGGGGATSVYVSLISDGQLRRYSGSTDKIIIVAGGGGGSGRAGIGSHYTPEWTAGFGGSGGGISGMDGRNSEPTSSANHYLWPGTGGTQSSAGNCWNYGYLTGDNTKYGEGGFGYGGNDAGDICCGGAGGGSGYYGGGGSGRGHGGAGGGSGYIKNTKLKSISGVTKHMVTNKYYGTGAYTYEATVTTSNNSDTLTYSTTCSDLNATSDCAKIGHGAVRISLIE